MEHEWYEKMFSEYPDVVDIPMLCQMLGGIGPKAAYKLVHEGKLCCIKAGRGFRIPKASVISFLAGSSLKCP